MMIIMKLMYMQRYGSRVAARAGQGCLEKSFLSEVAEIRGKNKLTKIRGK